ncbi:MAG: hypothetical protein WD025_07875 [Bacteriovoracaceae bacterium]
MNIFIKAFLLISFVLPVHGAHLVGVGTFVSYFNKVQVSDSGATRKFDLTPYFSYGQQFHIQGPHYFMPEIGLAYYHQTPKKVKKSTLFFHYDFSYIVSSQFIFRYGLTTYRHTISGEGGTISVRNGDNGYADFEVPSSARTTFFTTVDLGGEYFFNPKNSARFDLHIMNIRNFKNRAYNYLLTYNWYL